MSFVLEVLLPSVTVKDDSFWSQAPPVTLVSSPTRRLSDSLSPVCRQIASAVWVAAVGCALGVSIAFPSIALDAWTREDVVRLTNHQAGWFASVVQLISIPGSVLGGFLMDQLGPRRLLLLLLPSLAVSWFLLLPTIHYPTLLIAVRALQGVLVSGCGVCVYVYPCEVSEAGRRGSLGTLPEAAYSLGYLLTFLLATFLHWTTVVLLIPPCVFLPCIIAVAMVPESPAWLLRNGRLEEARNVLRGVRPTESNVEKELLSMQMGSVNNQLGEVKRCPGALLTEPRLLLPVLAAITLVILKECTGQIVVVLLVVNILRMVNVGVSPYWSSVLVTCARLVANLVCSLLFGHLPRRPILSVSSFIAGVAMMLLANYFYLSESGLWPEWVPLVCLVVFVVAYGGGVGPVSCLVGTELLPGAVRGIGSGLSTASISTMQFVLTFVATKAEDTQLYLHFWCFATGCLVLAGFAILLPETQNRKLEDIEQFWSEVAHRLSQSRQNLTPRASLKVGDMNNLGSESPIGDSVKDYDVLDV